MTKYIIIILYLTLLNLLMFKHISHIRPNHLSGYALVPMWPDNRGRTVPLQKHWNLPSVCEWMGVRYPSLLILCNDLLSEIFMRYRAIQENIFSQIGIWGRRINCWCLGYKIVIAVWRSKVNRVFSFVLLNSKHLLFHCYISRKLNTNF